MDNKRDFIIFLSMLFLSAGLISYGAMPPLGYGLMGMLWGTYGFFRLAYLSQNPLEPYPVILNLPAKILFGLSQKQEEQRQLSLRRLEKFDFMLWCLAAFLFVGWVLYCSFFPAEISIIKTVITKQEMLLDVPIQSAGQTFSILKTLSLYGIVGCSIAMATSFAANEDSVKSALYSLFPAFIAGVVFIFFFMPIANPAIFPNFMLPKGGGLGAAQIMAALSPEIVVSSQTAMMERMIETGWIGGYGLYALFLPVFLMFLKALVIDRQVLIPAIGLTTLAMTFLLDSFWLSSPVIQGLSLLGLGVVALSWGIAGLSPRDLTKEQK